MGPPRGYPFPGSKLGLKGEHDVLALLRHLDRSRLSMDPIPFWIDSDIRPIHREKRREHVRQPAEAVVNKHVSFVLGCLGLKFKFVVLVFMFGLLVRFLVFGVLVLGVPVSA